jgi:iron(III) transport system substrate-binding protein
MILRLFRERQTAQASKAALFTLVSAAALGGFVSVASAQSGGNATPYTYTGEDRTEKLIEGAKQEGRVSWYTSLAGPIVQEISKAFQEEYPEIKLDVYRAGSNDVGTRMRQEAMAGQSKADVVETTSAVAMQLRESGIAAPYYSPHAADMAADYKTPAEGDLVWGAASRISPIGFGYNTSRLPENAVPGSFQDLLDPKLKNKLALESTSTGVRWIGSVLHSMGDEAGREFLQKLAQNGVRVEAVSGSALMGLVAQGEVASSPAVFRNHAEQQSAAGAPVEWKPLDVVVGNIGNVMVVKDAKNPHAALLLADFILSEKGKQVLRAEHYALPSDDLPFKLWIPEAKLDTTEKYAKQYDAWQSLMSRVFR